MSTAKVYRCIRRLRARFAKDCFVPIGLCCALLTIGPVIPASLAAGSATPPGPAKNLRKDDPCRLVTAGEVAAVLGPLVGPPYRANGATPALFGTDCRYETVAGRSIRVSVTWEGGAQLISIMAVVEGMASKAGLAGSQPDVNPTVTGEWDKAQINQCCEFNALRGDRMIAVDVAGSRATLSQAADLAALAVKRLDQPLDFDGSAGVRQAEARAAKRPKRRKVCDLLPRADAEAIAGVPLFEPPSGDEESCTYQWPVPPAGARHTVKLQVRWTDGFHEMRKISAIVGQTAATPESEKPEHDDGAWDEFSESIIGVMAVKNDVLASVESGPFRQDIARAFIKKALTNLGK